MVLIPMTYSTLFPGTKKGKWLMLLNKPGCRHQKSSSCCTRTYSWTSEYEESIRVQRQVCHFVKVGTTFVDV
jgi:hypothetical protein